MQEKYATNAADARAKNARIKAVVLRATLIRLLRSLRCVRSLRWLSFCMQKSYCAAIAELIVSEHSSITSIDVLRNNAFACSTICHGKNVSSVKSVLICHYSSHRRL